MYKVEITTKTILTTVGVILGLYFIWILRDLFFSLLIAFIFMSSLRPIVNHLTKKKLPRTASVFIVYFGFIFFFIFLFYIIIPPLLAEFTILLKNLPTIIAKINPDLKNTIQFDTVAQYVPNVADQLVAILSAILSNAFFVISTTFFGFYFLLEEKVIKKLLKTFFPEERACEYSLIFEKAELRMSSWFWGELILMTVVGTFTYIGLILLGVKYALPLAVLAGLLEVVPNIGPIISSVPAILIGLSVNPVLGLSALLLYVLVQQFENHLIVPIIMNKVVGINPIVTLIALIIGGKVGGVLGVLLAIPIFMFVETIFTEVWGVNKPIKEKSHLETIESV